MPSLSNIHCFVELPGLKQRLKEFGTSYGDGIVETFVAVPAEPQNFMIHLKSSSFIASGLAVFVYIDGKYQCNRNRVDLVAPSSAGQKLDKHSLVDFRLRKKEERQAGGGLIAREWTFEKLNIVSADKASPLPNDVLKSIGCIEVIILRCTGDSEDQQGFSTARPSNSLGLGFGFDGPNDEPDRFFGMNSRPVTYEDYLEEDKLGEERYHAQRRREGYDDRHEHHSYAPSRRGSRNAAPPPPYAERNIPDRSRRRSEGASRTRQYTSRNDDTHHDNRRSQSQSHHHNQARTTRPSQSQPPRSAYAYDSRPVRPEAKRESYEELFHNRTADRIPSDESLDVDEVLARVRRNVYVHGQQDPNQNLHVEAEAGRRGHRKRGFEGLRNIPGYYPQSASPPSITVSSYSDIKNAPDALPTKQAPGFDFNKPENLPKPRPSPLSLQHDSPRYAPFDSNAVCSVSNREPWGSPDIQIKGPGSYVGGQLFPTGPFAPFFDARALYFPDNNANKSQKDISDWGSMEYGNYWNSGRNARQKVVRPPLPPVPAIFRNNPDGSANLKHEEWAWGNTSVWPTGAGHARSNNNRSSPGSNPWPDAAAEGADKNDEADTRPFQTGADETEEPDPPNPWFGKEMVRSWISPFFIPLTYFWGKSATKASSASKASSKTAKQVSEKDAKLSNRDENASKTTPKPASKKDGPDNVWGVPNDETGAVPDASDGGKWNIDQKNLNDKTMEESDPWGIKDVDDKKDEEVDDDLWGLKNTDANKESAVEDDPWGLKDTDANNETEFEADPWGIGDADKKKLSERGKDSNKDQNNGFGAAWGNTASMKDDKPNSESEKKPEAEDQNTGIVGNRSSGNADNNGANNIWGGQDSGAAAGEAQGQESAESNDFGAIWGDPAVDDKKEEKRPADKIESEKKDDNGKEKGDTARNNNDSGGVWDTIAAENNNVPIDSQTPWGADPFGNDGDKNAGTGVEAAGGWDNADKQNNSGFDAGPSWNTAGDQSDNKNDKAIAGTLGDGKSNKIPSQKQDKSSERKPHAPEANKSPQNRASEMRRPNQPVRLEPQPHWRFPPPPAKKHFSSGASIASEALLAIPEEKAKEKNIDHQVKEGKGYEYYHEIKRPIYLDAFEKPYAVFRFNYRSQAKLREMFGDEVPAEEPKKSGTPASIHRRLESMSKDEVIREYMKSLNSGEAKHDGGVNIDKWRTSIPSRVPSPKGSTLKGSAKGSKDDANKGSKKPENEPGNVWNSGEQGAFSGDNNDPWGTGGAAKAASNKKSESQKPESRKSTQKAASNKIATVKAASAAPAWGGDDTQAWNGGDGGGAWNADAGGSGEAAGPDISW
ncbi:hypothetical protein EJ04DRAFT_609381 [Polyplosphaeria fusca]|uniref:DUF7918 domain-containing protein n=1 Tax=Polyplosphaeria fusca TaxID=682080 RepID=A0A9P4V899_9PLEO|nr:hypothetical protein EJ04DRAFT_609381 [Polyplosphaeria fusca]